MTDPAKDLAQRHLPRLGKWAIGLTLAVLAFSLIGFLVVPPLAKSLLTDQLAAALHRPVAIAGLRINPYALSLTIEGLAIDEREGGGRFAGFDSLYVNLESSSLWRGAPVVREVRLVNPKIRIVRLADQRYNVSDLIDEFLAKPPGAEPPGAEPPSAEPPAQFSVNNIQLSGGAIEFDDRPLKKTHVVSSIDLALPFISNMAQTIETFVEPAFSARINDAPLAISGRAKPFADSRESDLAIQIDDLQLASYQDYIPAHLPIRLAAGALDGELKFVFRQDARQAAQLAVSGQAIVSGLAVNDASGSPLAAFKRLEVVVGSADLLRSHFVVERVTLDAPVAYARIGPQGAMNWQEMLDKASTDAGAAKPGVPAVAPAAIRWSLGDVRVNSGVLRWRDETRGKALEGSVEGFDLALKNLTSDGAADAEFDVAWRVSAGEWLKVDSFAIKGGRANLVKREVVLGELAVRGTRMLVRRGVDGAIETLAPPTLRAAQSVAGQERAAPWKVTLEKYRGEDLGVRFEDHAVAPAATQVISELKVDIDHLSTEPGQTTALATRFHINGKGQVALAGTLELSPLKVDLKVDLKGVEVLPLQPYFSEKINVEVKRGQVTLGGDLQLRQRPDGTPTSATGGPGLAGGFKGALTIGDFSAVDKLNSADFVRWKSLYFGKLDLRANPDSVAIEDIALADFFARVIISPEGKLNLLQLVRQDAATPTRPNSEAAPDPASPQAPVPVGGKAVATVSPPATPLPPISIGKVTLQGGSVNFTDNFVKPNYSARLRQIGGRVSGLSSSAGSIADVELRGSYDDVAPLTLAARVNPFPPKPFLDLQAEVKGIEMSSLSPYSSKYAGYAIEKGKLSVFVDYKLENNLLQAENRVFVDQLTFGEAVASPDATKLPVTLAVALLKNRRGEIDINLPISGSLDDPQFSIGGLIWRVIGNLLVKAVTSPFALLGSLFGGEGGELSTVEFDPGRAAISAEARGRLEKLAQALVERPALRLEVAARVDPEADREGAKRASIERKVRAQKREELADSGAPTSRGDAVEVSAEEYPALLERVYKAEKFPKPRTVIGLVKTLPVDEMEKLILANTTIDDDDLRGLGDRRARAVRDWLLAHEVPGERVFVLPSKLAVPAADDKYKSSRVDFALK